MHMQCTARLHRGLTLTETLTALVLLAIGVLCIATVYLERTSAAPAVLLHSKANRLAEEMADRMRSRLDQVHFENPVGVRCNPRLVDAKPQAMATNDIACWQIKVAETLPNGSGAIAHDSHALAPAYLITVSWSPPDRGTASYLLRVDAPPKTPTAPPKNAALENRKTATPAASSPPLPATASVTSPTDAVRAAN